ncbi:MAG: RNA-binding cell elongation regulator Jag/EloR [Bacillota bacterium]|jgi:spoIIIJ-associated protein
MQTRMLEKQGRTIEEAVEQALAELGLTEEQVEITVLEEPSKGFLGILGGRPARVQVVAKSDPLELTTSFLEGVCQRMGAAEVKISSQRQDENVLFSIDGDSLGLLIGKHGQTMNSLQYLASVVYNRNASEHARVLVDVGGYRARREEALQRLATRLAEKAKRTGRRVILEPMNAQERRVIHSTLQADKQIVTYSEGEEPYRKVVIALK